MKISVEVKIKLVGDELLLDSIYQALTPDNVGIPEGLAMKFSPGKRLLTMEFSIDKREMLGSLNATIDEILGLAEITVNTIGGQHA